MSGPNVETIRTADQPGDEATTLSVRHMRSRVAGDLLIIEDGEERVELSAEIGPHAEARRRLRELAVNALALAETLK